MQRVEGGAVLPMTPFWAGSAQNQHTAEQNGPVVSHLDMEATNVLQHTGWRINRRLLAVAQQAADCGHPALGVALLPPDVVPYLPADEWEALDLKGRIAASKTARRSRKGRLAWASELTQVTRLLTAAQEDAEHEHLYTVYSHCARLRRYPRVSDGPSPQGSGLSKALLEFDEGVPLGSAGLRWLAIRAATCAGLDKLSLDDRAQWSDDNLSDICASAVAPWGTDWWWRLDKDDPWGLLATCMELQEAMTNHDGPAAYLSRLPVQVDGTCNGIQHLSALSLDPRGAFATNLTACPDRQDIYAQVAAIVSAQVEEDAERGLEVALEWRGKIVRDTVKRAVMTTPYGVTKRGMQEQLIEDDEVPDDAEDERAAAAYLRDMLWDAVGHVVVRGRNTMDWLQTVAATLAASNIPFSWMTPAGSLIRQAYRPFTSRRLVTAMGRSYANAEVDKSALKVRKQALGAAPNFVHSFDAAHMARTVVRGNIEGITHWSTIHDSYGTHAARMDGLNRLLREEFVRIYSSDWLTDTYEFVRSYAPRVDVPQPPERGDFDIRQVLNSPWFFA